jgi:hypothetical protein
VEQEESQSSSSSVLRVEVAKNDGQRSVLKPIVVKSSDFEYFKKQACNTLKLKYSAQVFSL